ncbi:MAG: hypothetical protein WA891_19995 [Acidobacteriaceae bacterium]
MNFPYLLRLSCLLVVVVGLIQILLQLLLGVNARFILRPLQAATARQRERTLYLLQVGPILIALLFATAICFPQYLRFEPDGGAERVGWISILLASGVLLWFGTATARGLRIAVRTLRFLRAARIAGQDSGLRRGGIPVISLPNDGHVVALAGFLNPVILVPKNLLESGALNEQALGLALDHERAHAARRDNWKLLSLSFLPRIPGARADPWFRQWQRAAECAADDDAVRGDHERSLVLADALLRIARTARPLCSPMIFTALISTSEELAARIDRLIRKPTLPSASQRSMLLPCIVVSLAVIGAAVAMSPWAYGISELILHLG